MTRPKPKRKPQFRMRLPEIKEALLSARWWAWRWKCVAHRHRYDAQAAKKKLALFVTKEIGKPGVRH